MRAIRNIALLWIVAVLILLPGAVGGQTSSLLTEVCRISLGAPIESSPAGGDWPMFRHDAQHTGYVQSEPSEIYIGSNDLGLHALSSANCSRLWRFQTGGPVKSSPAVRVMSSEGEQDRIYFGSDDGKLYAVGENGSLIWNFTPPSDHIDVPGAFRSSPLIVESENRIFLGNDDGLVYSVELGTDRTNIDLKRFPSAPPTQAQIDMGVVPNADGVVPVPVGSIRSSPVIDTVSALDLEDSSINEILQIYFSSLDRRMPSITIDDLAFIEIAAGSSETLDGPSFSSPAVSTENIVYAGTASGTLYAIRPDFIQQWRVSLDGDIWASPAVASSGTIFIGTMNGTMYGVRPNGTIQCSFRVFGPDGRANTGDEQLYGIRSSAAVTPNGLVIFGADDGYLYVIEGQTCRLRTSFRTNGPIVSSPMVAETGNNRNKIYFGSGDGFFYILSLF